MQSVCRLVRKEKQVSAIEGVTVFNSLQSMKNGNKLKMELDQGITESQNHRIVGVGRDLCGSSSPNPPAEAGSPTVGCTGLRPGGA